MGTRTSKRGEPPDSYTDAELAQETARVETRIGLPLKLKAGLRKRLESRLHNLRREQMKRGKRT
ncbi:MAG: hypothetical protein ACJ798_02765 [Phenylobacterium sp.]